MSPSGAPFFLVPTTSKHLLRRLIFKGYNDLLPLALVDQLTQRSCRSTTRLKHGLIAWVKIYAKLYCLQRGLPLEGLGMQWEDLMDRSWSVPTLSPSPKALKSYTFMDFNFNVLAPQTINYRCKSFKYFQPYHVPKFLFLTRILDVRFLIFQLCQVHIIEYSWFVFI